MTTQLRHRRSRRRPRPRGAGAVGARRSRSTRSAARRSSTSTATAGRSSSSAASPAASTRCCPTPTSSGSSARRRSARRRSGSSATARSCRCRATRRTSPGGPGSFTGHRASSTASPRSTPPARRSSCRRCTCTTIRRRCTAAAWRPRSAGPVQANAYCTPAGVAGLRRAPRHPRRLRAAGLRPQALAHLRAGRRAAAEGPALVGATRPTPSASRCTTSRCAPATRSTSRAAGRTRRPRPTPARCTSPSACTRRRAWTRCARRSPTCADDVEFRRALDADGELPADAGRAPRRAPAPGRRRAPRAAALRRHAAARSSTASSRRCARSTRSTIDTPLERRATVIADLEPRAGRRRRAALRGQGRCASRRRPPRRVAAVHARDGAVHRRASCPAGSTRAGRLVLVRRLVREGFLLAPGARSRLSPGGAPRGLFAVGVC